MTGVCAAPAAPAAAPPGRGRTHGRGLPRTGAASPLSLCPSAPVTLALLCSERPCSRQVCGASPHFHEPRPLAPTPMRATRTSQRSTEACGPPGATSQALLAASAFPRDLAWKGLRGALPGCLPLRVCPPTGEMLREPEPLSCADASSASGRCPAWGSGVSPHGTAATSAAAASWTWRFSCEGPRARPW